MALKPPEQSFFRSSHSSILPRWLFGTLIASGFAVIMWAVGLGVYISHSKTNITPPSETLSMKPAAPSDTLLQPTPLVISPKPPPTEWKKYKSAHYSISYPPNWTLKEFSGSAAVEIYNPSTAKDPHNPLLIGSALASQFVLITSVTTNQSPVQYIGAIEVTCCIGPSPIATTAATLFQKQSITINHQTGYAYTPPINNFTSWDIVYAVNSLLLDISSSVDTLAGTKTENQILNTLQLNPS